MSDIASNTDTQPQDETYSTRSVPRPHVYPNGPRSVLSLYNWLRVGYITYIIVGLLFGLLIALILLPMTMGSNVWTWPIGTLDALGTIMVVLPICFMVIYLFCIIMTCRVTYRAMRNLHTIGSKHVSNSPTMSVVYYFIPFANLVMPAQVTSDIYRGTMHATDGIIKNGRVSLWWACWLISNIADRIATRLDFNLAGTIISLVSLVFSIVAAYALLSLFRDISHAQEDLKHGGIATVFD